MTTKKIADVLVDTLGAVIVNRQELSMPPTITVEQMRGFSLYTIKAIHDGRGANLIDLAKTNQMR